LTARRDQLFEEHACRPLPTIVIPVLTQLPLFVLTSAVLAQLSKSPTPFDSESFLTLTTLAHPDPTAALPVILGIVTLANVESSRWFMSEEEREREKKVNEWNATKRAQGHLIIEPKKHIQSSLRLLSVGRILLGSLVPGVRTFFSFFQNFRTHYHQSERCSLLAHFCHVWSHPNLAF
jgi:inner membrane protein COX18